MGLKIRVSEITSYLNQINTSLSTKNDGLNQIMQGMQRFIDTPELTGRAWSAAQSYAATAHIPLLRGQARANDEIINDNLTFASRIAEKIENEEIDEDALNRIIERLEQQKQAIVYRNSLLDNSPSFGTRNVNLEDGFTSITVQIYELRTEIQSLHDLESSCSDLYATADSLLDNVSQGLSALSSTDCFDGSNGIYSTAKLKLDWAKRINKEWKDNFVLPLDYAKLVQEIKDDKSLSPTEKADKIVRVYENYLYSLAKPAFDEYDTIRLNPNSTEQQIKNTEDKLAKILRSPAIDIKAIARSLGNDAIEVSGGKTLNYLQFVDMVNTGKPLDLKSRTFGESKFSIWARPWTKDFIIDGEDHSKDYLGNYLFGYYGQGALLLGDETLKMGAGSAQILSDTNKGKPNKLLAYTALLINLGPIEAIKIWKSTDYGDNPDDGNMVQEGINDFKKYNKNK